MPTPYIVGAVRTPIGRAGGALAAIRPDDLAAVAVRALVERTPIPAERIDDVILGCANQAGEDNRNVARMALVLAGLPVAIPGRTVNRLCGSGLQAAIAPPRTRSVRAKGDIFVAGGVESMTRAPYITLKSGKAWDRNPPVTADSTVGWRFVNPRLPTEWTISLGETAEKVAREYGVSRQDTRTSSPLRASGARRMRSLAASSATSWWRSRRLVPTADPGASIGTNPRGPA